MSVETDLMISVTCDDSIVGKHLVCGLNFIHCLLSAILPARLVNLMFFSHAIEGIGSRFARNASYVPGPIQW